MEEKTVQLNGATLHVLPTEKFKNITIAIKLKNDLTLETTTIRTLLSFVLSGGTKKLPDQQALSIHLENLYGMRFASSVSTKGTSQIINLLSICINDEYLPEKQGLLEQQLSLLHDVLFDLNTDGNAINETILNQKKRELRQRLIAAKNDKYSYALDRLLKEMGEGQVLGIPSTGFEEEIDAVTAEQLYDYYQKCIKEDIIDVYAIGNIHEEDIDLFKQYLSFGDRETKRESVAEYQQIREDVLEIVEVQDITQAKLKLGYAINTNFLDEDHYAFTVFNGMFGGFAHSKLFKVVREEHSLCYYISSSYDAFNSIMVISSGIDEKESEKVKELVAIELEKFKQGDISEEDFNITKVMLVNGLKKADDDAGNILALRYNRDIVGKQETNEEYMQKLMDVTLEDIQKVANKVSLDTVYLLKGEAV